MSRTTKTRLVAIHPDGHRYPVHFRHGLWWWDHGSAGFPQADTVHDAEAYEGVTFVREPHPHYRPANGRDRIAATVHRLLGGAT